MRDETTPEDFHGIVAARAVLTARGGMTSHAAVVARGMGKCAVVGCQEIHVDLEHRRFTRRRRHASPKATGSRVDGATGNVYRGDLPTTPSEVVAGHSRHARRRDARRRISAFARLLGWADEVRRLKVRANADTPHDARIARGFGAEGIGLCRTEHMFFEGDRITAMREMIVARDEGGRRRALAKLLPMQRARLRGDLRGDGRAAGHDPPARSAAARVPSARRRGEQAPRAHARHSARRAGAHRRESLRETNPMLGHRGCRLGITYPEITEMQGRAIFEAAVRAKRRGIDVRPEIMIPLVADAGASSTTSARSSRTSPRQVLGGMGEEVAYTIGTMIELPRAALTADEIAEQRRVLLLWHQ